MADGKPFEKRKGSRATRRQGTKSVAGRRVGRVYYRECLDRRKDKTKGA